MSGELIHDIETVIPHRGTLLLLDQVLEHDEEQVVVELQVPFDGPFHEAGGVPAYIGLEYMAQAVACWAGCRARARGLPPPLGFLLGSRRYACVQPHFAAGSRLRVEARCELMGDNGLGVFACRILADGRELAAAHVSVYEPDDVQAYLAGTTQTGEAG